MFFQIEEEDKILGTPSAQKILRLFAIFENLTLKEIIDKTGLSDAQIHKTLNNLQKINLITKKEKGNYQIAENSNSKAIQEAILNRITILINEDLKEIDNQLVSGNREEAHDKFLYLIKNFEPMLKRNFKYKLNSIVHQFLE